jgi:hypothetical protein
MAGVPNIVRSVVVDPWKSVDMMDENCNYTLGISPHAVRGELKDALSLPPRVVVVEQSERELDVITVKHTPAWARPFWPLLSLLFRRTRTAHLSIENVDGDTHLRLAGSLDTRAADRLRQLRAKYPARV